MKDEMNRVLQKIVNKYEIIDSITTMDEPGMEYWFDVKSPRFRGAYVINFSNGEKFVFNEKTFKDLGNGRYEVRDICQWNAPFSLTFQI